ncbi:DUF2069 domain-containing protein [Aquabacterium sp. J223]|uniref:DUF2069 domain-containing protein n=1 Tax=Aquabacterium sp. J223 TaxID=2898431 RepID=UPI0021AE0998|nr:DUF2069 domain-containing protein [Aquabacterium sp. J223]UUX94167.1 DUF2069 domain-containing protein [Aquabacterium sp. J223]
MPGLPLQSDAALGASPSSSPSLSKPASAGIRFTRALAVGSVLGLIVLGLLWELWLAPTGQRSLVLKVLPLLLPLPGLLKHRMYTYRWLSLLVWIYFTEGAVRATSDTGISALLAAVEVVLCLLLFTACALHVRWRLRNAAAARGDAT